MKLKINNKNENPLWKKISCKCNHDSVETEYPLVACIHCQCQQADNSIPSESFKVKKPIINKNGKIKEYETIEIKEITLTNCQTYGSCIGWCY